MCSGAFSSLALCLWHTNLVFQGLKVQLAAFQSFLFVELGPCYSEYKAIEKGLGMLFFRNKKQQQKKKKSIANFTAVSHKRGM